MAPQEQEPQLQRKGPPAGWRYSAQAKHRARLRGWLAKVWRGVKNNAALVSLVGVLLTLLVTTVLAQQEQIRNAAEAQKLADQQAQAARLQTERQAQYSALQSYIDEMSLLIDERNLQGSGEGDVVFTLAQARTTTTMAQLDGEQNQIVALFLSGSGLLRDPPLLVKTGLEEAELPNAVLPEANLAGTNLKGANLTDAKLSSAVFSATEKVGENTNHITADLTKAHLTNANLLEADLTECTLDKATLTKAALQGANLSGASLQDANLSYAALQNADLSGAVLQSGNVQDVPLALDVPLFFLKKEATNLTDAKLSHAALQDANLSSAYLSGADLTNANLADADLTDAYLSDADLTGAKGWTTEQLMAARTLEGATMPDGQTLKSDKAPHGPTFEEWLKD
jgi:uncharacterized protein YjbI with pentapeptide repeats